ncbi:MAG: hypothetical protein Q4G65_11680 [bacterium]|nr:hypothetical protein [bacterium]
MNGKLFSLGVVALTTLGTVAAGHHSKAKTEITSPISVDASEARMTSKEVDALFQNEITLRDRMLAERFFAKPLSDQKSALGAMVAYLGLDPLHGLQPRFVLDGAKNEAAMKDYNDWARYLVEGHMRLKLHTLLRKAQIVLFDRPAQMVSQLEFYRKVGAEASAGLRIFDDIMYKLASGTPAFRKEHPEGGKWSDVLDYCKVDRQTFYYYYQIDENTRQLRLDSYFLNQLGAVKTHGDALPPATAEEWSKAAEKFKNEDVAQYRQAAQAAVERANRNPRVVAIMEKDLAVVAAMEKILDGMHKINEAFNDGENSAGRLRTGKGLYKYTKGKYSLPDMPKDKVPDHVFLLNLMLTRYQSYMQGLKVRMQGVTEEQRRKAAAWRKSHLRSN